MERWFMTERMCKYAMSTFDLRCPPNVCCIKVVSCNLGSTLFSPPSPSKHIDCIDVIRSLDKDSIICKNSFIKIWIFNSLIWISKTEYNMESWRQMQMPEHQCQEKTHNWKFLTDLKNSCASSWLPSPIWQLILLMWKRIRLGERGPPLSRSIITCCSSSHMRHQSLPQPSTIP